jgi:hypothetical protein
VKGFYIAEARVEMGILWRDGQHHDLTNLVGTAYSDKFAALPTDHLRYGSADEFIAGLRWCWERTVESKDEAGLLSPAIFDPDATDETKRGYGNVVALRGIWLDMDGGDMTPEEIACLLPKMRMAVFNSYSSTKDNPRFRVVIPTTHAMSMDVHRLITDQIVLRLNRAGFFDLKQIEKRAKRGDDVSSLKRHGLDLGKLVPTSLFYLPAQAGAGAEASFFTDHADGRAPLNPYHCVDSTIVHQVPEMAPPIDAPEVVEGALDGDTERTPMRALAAQVRATMRPKRDHAAEAIDRWRQMAPQKGVGNHEFFVLACGLVKAGLSDNEVKMTMTAEAQYSHSRSERLREIKNAVRSARKLVGH